MTAVTLEQTPGHLTLLKAEQADYHPDQWHNLAQRLTQNGGDHGSSDQAAGHIRVAGMDTAAVAFYSLDLPAVNPTDLPALVAVQAEALLPLSLEQMTWAWRAGQSQNGKLALTLAAAKTTLLQSELNVIRKIQPEKVILDAEALVYGWRKFYRGNDRPSLVVYIAEDHTQLCLANQGALTGAARLDLGMQDYAGSTHEPSRAIEQLAHDIRAVLERFFDFEMDQVNVHILSDGSQTIRKMVDYLSQVNLRCEEALPQKDVLDTIEEQLDTPTMNRMLPTLSIAAMALESDSQHIDLTKTLYQHPTKSATKKTLPSVPLLVATILVLLTTCLLVAYRADVRVRDRLENQMQAVEVEMPVADFLHASQIRRSIAGRRINLLELFEVIQANRTQDVVLDSLEFKRHQPVTLKGHIKNENKAHYQFLEKLQAAKGISDARLIDPVYDKKKKEMSFTIKFHYKNFSKKK